jgi:hypothetical protein
MVPWCIAGPGVVPPVPYSTLWPQSTANNTYAATFVFSTGLYNATGAESFCRRQGGHLAAYRSYDEQLEVEEFFVNSVCVCVEGGGAGGADGGKERGGQRAHLAAAILRRVAAAIRQDEAAAGSARKGGGLCRKMGCRQSAAPKSRTGSQAFCRQRLWAAATTPARTPLPSQGYLLPSFHNNYWLGLAVRTAWPVFRWLDPFTPGPFPSTYRHWGTYRPDMVQEPFSGNGELSARGNPISRTVDMLICLGPRS